MALRREKVTIDATGLAEYASRFERMRRVITSMGRNDKAQRENPLYAADPRLPGPQVWEGDDL